MEKSTGVVRKIDKLGRIVLPVELRERLEMDIGASIEIYTNGNSITLKKFKDTYCPECLTRCDHDDKFCRNCGKEFKKLWNK